MSLSNRLYLSLLAGTVAALLAWIVIDFNGIWSLGGAASSGPFLKLFADQAPVGIIFGVFLGLAIGAVNGLGKGSARLLQRELMYGAILGLAGGLLGLFFGQLIFGIIYIDPSRGSENPALGPFIFLVSVFARAIGWALIGFFLGFAQGLPSSSGKASRNGAIGGFIGGLLGGMLFELLRYLVPGEINSGGTLNRGIGMAVTGASIGFFIGLVENLLKQGWIRVLSGRNEGREYIISKQRTTIGRDELADIGLFGDFTINPLHAVIESLPGGRHVLRDSNTQIGTSVNGNRITEHMLRDGELIQIGSMKLEFHEKATASKVPLFSDVSSNPVQIPLADNMCPFCGGRKDPVTGACACTVGQVAPPPQVPPPSWNPPQAPDIPSFTSALPGGIPKLVGTSGPYAGQTFMLSPDTITSVGREDGRQIVLAMDTTVSRRHAYISNEAGIFVVYDEGSSNGTTVNGIRINRQPLAHGDTVSFGSSAFRFEA